MKDARSDFAWKEAVEAVKHRVDLASVVSRHVKLEKAPKGFKACCPLPGHKEKTPFFNIDARSNVFYCFGCSRGGDVFEFMKLVEGLNFREALEELAGQAGITLPKSSSPSTDDGGQAKSRFKAGLDMLERAQRFFQRYLTEEASPGAREGRAYLDKRGFTLEDIERFGLGWAPENGQELARKLKDSPDRDLAFEVELIRDWNGRTFDFFSDRLIIPIYDARGKAIAFSGRTLKEVIAGKNPKYKNSQESPWFKKKHVLYGLNWAAPLMRQDDYVCLVEGYFDQWAFLKRDIPAVAVMGTALTPEHLVALKRHTKQIVLVLDTDEAGIRAMKRALPLAIEAGFDVKIFAELEGKDPDEWLKSQPLADAAAVKNKILSAPSGLEWWAKRTLHEGVLQKKDRTQLLRSLAEVWTWTRSDIHRTVLADEVLRMLNLGDGAEARRELMRSLDQEARSAAIEAPRQRPRAEEDSGPEEPPHSVSSAPWRPAARTLGTLEGTARELFTWTITQWDLLGPQAGGASWERLAELFADTPGEEILPVARKMAETVQTLDASAWAEVATDSALSEESKGWIYRALATETAPIERKKVEILLSFEELARSIRRERTRLELLKLQSEARHAVGDQQATERILQRIHELRMSLEKT